MPRLINASERYEAIQLMLKKDATGTPYMSQREIERVTKLSRPYIRKLAHEIGHKFPRNGIEVRGVVCVCANCGMFFRKPPSRVARAKNQFCDEFCKQAWMKGANHPSWTEGKSANTFSTWVKNQEGYKTFVKEVLERDGYKCVVSGKTEDLEAHHILFKSTNPEEAFNPVNGITLSKEVHTKIHQLARQGVSFDDAVAQLKKEYNNA